MKRIAKPADFGQVENRIRYATLPQRIVRLQLKAGNKVIWSSEHNTRNDFARLRRFCRKLARSKGKIIQGTRFFLQERNNRGQWETIESK